MFMNLAQDKLLVSGWLLFIVSLFLPWWGITPSAQGLPGFFMVPLSLFSIPDLFQADASNSYLNLLGILFIISFFILLSPLFYFRLIKGKCQRCWIAGAISSALLLISVVVGLVANGEFGPGNKYGYYVWCISVPLVSHGLYLKTRALQQKLFA